MNSKQITNDSKEILNRIDRFTHDADLTNEELRESLRAEGIDPDSALTMIKSRLAPIYKFKQPPTAQTNAGGETEISATVFPGIWKAAEQLNLAKSQLVEMSGLSETLLIKLDRRLISLGGFKKIAATVADALRTTQQTILDYVEGFVLYPAEANFKAESLPELPPKQSFAEAVKTDPLLSEEEKAHLLSQRDDD